MPTIKPGARRRFHNDGEVPGMTHTVTAVDAENVYYRYDDGVLASWPLAESDMAGGYADCTEEVVR